MKIVSNLDVNESRSDSLHITGEQLCATQDFTQRCQWQMHKLHGFDGIVALEHDKCVDRRLRATASTTLTTRQCQKLGMDQVLPLHQQNMFILQTYSSGT